MHSRPVIITYNLRAPASATTPPHYGLKLYEIDAFKSWTSFSWARERVSEQASERMSSEERASKASSAEQAKELRGAREQSKQMSKQCEQTSERTR